VCVCSGHTDHVLCVQFDDEKIISGSADKTIKVRHTIVFTISFEPFVVYFRFAICDGRKIEQNPLHLCDSYLFWSVTGPKLPQKVWWVCGSVSMSFY